MILTVNHYGLVTRTINPSPKKPNRLMQQSAGVTSIPPKAASDSFSSIASPVASIVAELMQQLKTTHNKNAASAIR
jgi:hypothetical protein